MNAALLMLLSAVPGGGCHAVKAVVVQQEVAAVAVVQPVIVPLYSFAYAPPAYVAPAPVYQQPVQQYVQPAPAPQQQVAAPPQPLAVQEEPCDLCQELRKLRLEVARLRGAPVASQPATPAQPITGVGVIGQRCASCHSAANAVANGGGFVLVTADGKLAPLSLPEKRRIIELTSNDRMPKRPHQPLTSQEKDALKAFLEGGGS